MAEGDLNNNAQKKASECLSGLEERDQKLSGILGAAESQKHASQQLMRATLDLLSQHTKGHKAMNITQHAISENPAIPDNPVAVGLQSSMDKKMKNQLMKKQKKSARKRKGKREKPDPNELKKEINMDEHKIPLDELVERLTADLQRGLTKEEHDRRLKRDGLNTLTPPKKTPEIVKLARQLFSGFALLLWFGAVLCFVAYAIQAGFLDIVDTDLIILGSVLVSVVVISGLFSYFQEAKGSKIMEGFAKMIPPAAVVIRDGQARDVLAEELVVGDVVQMKGGDGVPADIRIIQSYGLKVDNSALTGEPDAILRSVECTHENPLETKNLAFYSTNLVEGTGMGIVINTGDNTVMGRIASLVTNVVSEDTPIKREIAEFIKLISIFAIILGILLAVAFGVVSHKVIPALVFMIAIIVANVPEGLLPTVTVILTITAKKMAKKFCLVKNLEGVETLGSTSTICSDKTGTLTQNRMTVSHLWCDGDITVADISDDQILSREHLESGSYQRLMRCVTLCNRAAFKPDQEHLPILQRETIADASESALFKYTEIVYGNCQDYREVNTKVCEVPFNSINKYQLSIHVKAAPISHGTAGSLFMVMKGAPEQIIERCSVMYAKGSEQPLDDHWKENFSIAYNALGGMGERVLGFADKNLDPKKFDQTFKFETEPEPNFPTTDLRFLGLVTLIDPARPSVPDAVAKCQAAGVRVIMVTGDHPITAGAIARSVGIITPGSETIDDVAQRLGIAVKDVDPEECRAAIIHGQDLKELNEEQLDILLQYHHEIVFARTSPQQKLIIVEGCQRSGAIVAVTGDGVNDSPALKKADIGVAMGIAGTEVSKQAADMILLDDNFSSIVTGIEEGRVIFDNIKKTIAYVLTSNMPEMVPFIISILLGFPLPLGTITILFIDLGTDIIPCIAMAYEYGEANVMSRPPRNPRKDKLVTMEMFYISYAFLGMIETTGAFLAWFVVLASSGWWPYELAGARKNWEDVLLSAEMDGYGQEWTYLQRQDLKYLGQSVFFVGIVLCQIVNIIQSRTRFVSLFKHGCRNKWIPVAIFSEIVVAVFLDYCPGVDRGLKFRALRGEWWFIALPFAIFLFAFSEIRKAIIRNRPGGYCERQMGF